MNTILNYFSSPTKPVKGPNVDKTQDLNKSDEADKIKSNDSECSNSPPTLNLNMENDEKPGTNAFQVMMDSRSKIIGRNSSGKELTDQSDEEDTIARKQTLKDRQKMMKKWAEDKGSAKRKRAEEERENFINNQMEKRTRRMKKLLEFNEESNEKRGRNRQKNTDSTWKMKIKLTSPSENGRKLRPRKEKIDIVTLSSDDEEINPKPVKVAALFTKNSSKPKLDPEQAAARKSFLLSGLPSNLKRTVEKEQALELREYDVFPQISHVQQFTAENKIGTFKSAELTEPSPLRLEEMNLVCNGLINSSNVEPFHWKTAEKITKFTQIVKEIKVQQPNYPVYKVFKQIHAKYNKKKKKPLLWTAKYSPVSAEEFFGNRNSVDYIKRWLSKFEESGKKKRRNSESEFEFSSTDGESSRDSTDRTNSNTIILVGPPGSGKTSTIYGLCKELGYEVLEVNASSRRTGKKLLQTVQEATQSHRMKNNKKCNKISVLLVEDIDIVFDQDDGFITALLQLIQTTKRPIILTTTDAGSPLVQRFTNHRFVVFRPMTSTCLGTWLQLICLVEGIQVEYHVICTLLEYFKGDTRRTLSQLQFWVLSGGDLSTDALQFKINVSKRIESRVSINDDTNLSFTDGKLTENESSVHKNCFKTINHQLTPELVWLNINKLPEKPKVNTILEFYENLTFVDRLGAHLTCNIELKDGIGTNEVQQDYNSSTDILREFSEVILNECAATRTICDVGLDISGDFSRDKSSIEPFNFILNRKTLCLDYFSAIRHINRVEEKRAENNTKRRNRFRHYLTNDTKNFNCLCKPNNFM